MNTQKTPNQLDNKKMFQHVKNLFFNIKIGRLTRMLTMHPLTSSCALSSTFDAAQANALDVDGWQIKTVCCECSVHNCSICGYKS